MVETVSAAAAQRDPAAGEQFLGTWSGTWTADNSSGGIELTLEKSKDGGLAGGVSVTGDPTYKAVFRTVAFDGPKMTAAYDFPDDETIEVVLTGTFEGRSAKGTWTARAKAGGAEVATGGWSATSTR
jgi:hypothetical protein